MMSHTKKEFFSVKKIVLKLLEEDEKCRNSDKWLIYNVMKYYTDVSFPFENFLQLPSFESIRRIRAKIQNEKKLFPPTEKDVIAKRKGKQDDVMELLVEDIFWRT